PILVSPAIHGGTINVRYFMPHKCHGALAVTGAIAIATSTLLPDSIVKQYIDSVDMKNIAIEHLSGMFEVSLTPKSDFPKGLQASIIRTARKLFEGDAF
ncbi:isomerase, partial [Vibrio parahaemolyticus]|uniref:PrpF domain-containing protein n=1 Tax=Vibrio parahaemolyticus TaxID=670 RepID=UPI001169E750